MSGKPLRINKAPPQTLFQGECKLPCSMPKSEPYATHPSTTPDWRHAVRKYQQPSLRKGLWQITNTLGPYAAIWISLHFLLPISWWLTAPLVLLAGGLLVRVFIIFHDCTHGSFFKSKQANNIVGYIMGVLVFTPYSFWRKEHALHHSNAADLDRRGFGDIPTMTVQEYRSSSTWTRLGYRFVRNPFVLFGIGPILMFLLKHRLPPTQKATASERSSVQWTNLGVIIMAGAMISVFGLLPYLIIQVAILAIATSCGTWLFYIQHQFEGVYWERNDKWNYVEAALKGSSFYKLPRILQWFSGNIGYHHVHHLSSRIPNYNLERCHIQVPLLHAVQPITLRESIRALRYRLWDEASHQLIGFKDLPR